MAIPESQWPLIWKGIDHWRIKNNLSLHYFSLLTAGTKEPYPTDRIARGIRDGSERISSDLLHICVIVFRLVPARQRGAGDLVTDEECIKLLTAPVMNNDEQGKFRL